MIDYKKLVPFKVDCKTLENSAKLQKLLFKQGFRWYSHFENSIMSKTLLFIDNDYDNEVKKFYELLLTISEKVSG